MPRLPGSEVPAARSAKLVLVSFMMLTLLAGCDPATIEAWNRLGEPWCDPDVGVCPLPEPGIIENSVGIQKSLWLEEERIGFPEPVYGVPGGRSLCAADINESPATELIFVGPEGLAVVAPEAGTADVLSFAPLGNPDVITMLDIDGDGNAEFLTETYQPTIRSGVWSHDGRLLWERDNWVLTWVAAEGDGVVEFLVKGRNGIEVLARNGTLIATIGNRYYDGVQLSDLDGNSILEVVTSRWLRSRDGPVEIATWALDGRQLGTFVAEGWDVEVVRLREDDPREFIAVGRDDTCELYEIDGTRVFTLPWDEETFCPVEGVDHQLAPIENTCSSTAWDDWNTPTLGTPVRFLLDAEPFAVELSHSKIFTPAIMGGGWGESVRTILKVYDGEGALVYHEVIDSRSGPGSFAVIPSDVAGAEILLVAENTRILAYRLGKSDGS
jgi:hypothetical protein